jgi:hypothetical protein
MADDVDRREDFVFSQRLLPVRPHIDPVAVALMHLTALSEILTIHPLL